MILFLWYPKCSTCQKAYKTLKENNVEIKTQDIKTNPPTIEELRKYWKQSGLELKKFFNTSGLIYKELNLKEKLAKMSEEEQLKLLSENGMLIKRPILIMDDEVIVGYNQVKYLNLGKGKIK